MLIQPLQEFLNSHKIKYITINHSPAYTKQELVNCKRAFGMELIEAVLVEIENNKISMVVMPASLQINLGSLREALGTTEVRLLDQREVENLFPGCEFGTVPPFRNLYNMDVFLAANLSQNQEVAFYVGSYAHLIQMKYRDFEKLANFEKGINFLTRPKYRVIVSAVSPESARQELKNYDSCILGLSLENESFSTAKLVAITDWISKHFKKCTVMIGDSLHRITLQTDRGLQKNKALNKALLLGREYIDRQSLVFERHADTCPFNIVLSSEIQKWDDYLEYYEKIQHLFGQDEKFANSVKSFAKTFIWRRLKQNSESFNRCVEMSCRYLLEEFAIFACLTQSGLSVMVYPGSLAIFEEIAEGEHPNVPDCFQKIIYVSLHLRRR